MNLSGKQKIAATRARVWEGLNDPEILRQSIPGCQSMEKQADDRFTATVAVKVGPIGARLVGVVTISDLDPINSYTLTCEGDGGTTGFVKSTIRVQLVEEEGGTVLAYQVDAQVGGRLAQLGGAVVEATAKQLAGKFFKRFSEVLVAPEAVEPTAAAQQKAAAQVGTPSSTLPAAVGFPAGWVVALLASALVGYLIGSSGTEAALSGWIGLSVGLLLMIVAAAAYGLGRRGATTVVVMDETLLKRLTTSPAEDKP